MVTPINIWRITHSSIKCLHGHKICIRYILTIVPVDGDAQHLQGYQIWEGFTLHKERSTVLERLQWTFRL